MDTRTRLLESTQDLLWDRGYVGTSPRAIQERAGAGQGSMYHHFSGKHDLAVAAMRLTTEQVRERAEQLLGAEGTAYARVEAYLRFERDALRGCRVGRMTQDPEVVADDELRAPVADAIAWQRGRIAQVLAEGVARGELSPALSPERTAATLVAVVQGAYVEARAAGSREPYDAAIEGALDLLRACVLTERD
ncbi:AcrR family transcriptional regulator [Motilibacter peucedani]|uniref:AcrR family transcriptional regulator n=1 Tax=Motilibacter peucedani TaxID=598650 RepID=A0A420XUB5_9ACTN|nr:TetR/AcrR family transcriptional regulator [Motilibacter peucedani]RKS80462.1 AcrR family transcriptional regulator [Motilibacter peucedani]